MIDSNQYSYKLTVSISGLLLEVNRINSIISPHWGIVRLDLCSYEQPQHNPHGHISYSIRMWYKSSTSSGFIPSGNWFLQPTRLHCFQCHQETMQLTSRWSDLSLRVFGRMESTRQCEKSVNQHHKGCCLWIHYVLHPVIYMLIIIFQLTRYRP